MARAPIALLLAGLLLQASPAVPQEFGQNQVIRKDFDWKVSSTAHFDIHYYEGSAAWVPQAAKILERAYERLSRTFDHTFKERVPFFLYANVNDFQQSNIAAVGDGTGGVTEAFKDRFMVFCDGSEEWLEHVTVHELVHVFQFKILHGGFWKSVRVLKTVFYPLWFVEGMAEYYSEGLDLYSEETVLRDRATSPRKGLIPLEKLLHFQHLKPHEITPAYKEGAAALRFVAREYGPEKIPAMLRVLAGRFEINSVLLDVLGTDLATFDRKFREYLSREYAREVEAEGLREPEAFGDALTKPDDDIPQFDLSPAFAADGSWMAYLTTRDGHPPEVHQLDLKTGRTRQLMGKEPERIENLPLGNFSQYSRNLAASPDGRWLAFFAQKNHEEYLYLYDLRRRRLERRPLRGFQTLGQPAFSPDGKTLAFSGLRDGVSDLWLYGLETRTLTPVTQDPQDDQSPSFSPDGERLLYASETGGAEHGRGLFVIRLADGSRRPVARVAGRSRDPVFHPDGRRILFVNDMTGVQELYEADLESGAVQRLTRTVAGVFTPAAMPDGRVAFAAYRHGEMHVHAGARDRFLSERVEAAPAPGPEPDAPPASRLSPERPYRFNASTDLFLPAFFYSSPGGLFWTHYWQGSDMLGNHQVSNYFTYNSGAPFVQYQLGYTYGRFRPRLHFQVQGLDSAGNVDAVNDLEFDESNHQGALGVTYPFDRYHRLELALSAEKDKVRYPDVPISFEDQYRTATAALVRDTVSGRYLVPLEGSRLRAEAETNRRVLGGTERFDLYQLEAQQFVPAGGQSAFGFRGVGQAADGPDQRVFRAGGLGGVRGFSRSRTVGRYAAYGNAEYRFPMVRNLDYNIRILPDLYFKSLYGTVFTDVGWVWQSGREARRAQLADSAHSVGAGVRLHTFILQAFPIVISIDVAKRTTSREYVAYFYAGPLF